MRTGPDGRAVMHYFESCRLEAYPDPYSPLAKAMAPAGIKWAGNIPARFANLSGRPWTIGWGDTGPDVVPGLVITQDQADERFERRLLLDFEPLVQRYVKVELTQGEFDAMVEIFYNVGPGAADRTGVVGRDGIAVLRSGQPSTLLRKLNAGDKQGAADQFPSWNRAGGVVSKGLQRRRHAGRLVFLGSTAAPAIAAALKAYP